MTKNNPTRGPKRPQTHAEAILREEQADAAIVCVVNGKCREGFSVAVKSMGAAYAIPTLLRQIAAEMEARAPSSVTPIVGGFDPITGGMPS